MGTTSQIEPSWAAKGTASVPAAASVVPCFAGGVESCWDETSGLAASAASPVPTRRPVLSSSKSVPLIRTISPTASRQVSEAKPLTQVPVEICAATQLDPQQRQQQQQHQHQQPQQRLQHPHQVQRIQSRTNSRKASPPPTPQVPPPSG